MKHYWLLLLLVALTATVAAQKITRGMKLPEDVKVRLSQTIATKNKGVIGKWWVLDFWNQGCISCITAIPKMGAVQEQFNESLQIIMINRETVDSTRRFFERRKKIPVPAFPMVSGAADIWAMFSGEGIPFQVWIDTAGIVQYITGGYNLTPEHFSAAVKGGRPYMHNMEESSGVAAKEPALPLYYSSITHCNAQTGRFEFEALAVGDSGIHMCKPCYSVTDLYRKAYSGSEAYSFDTPAQLVVEGSNRYTVPRPDDEGLLDQWIDNYSFTYDLVLPRSKKAERYAIMQQDLQRFFGLTASVERRRIKCWALVKKGSLAGLESAGGKPLNNLVSSSPLQSHSDTVRVFSNGFFKKFIENLGAWVRIAEGCPFIDLTGYSGKVDMVFRESAVDPFNRVEMQKDLGKYNLALVQTVQWADVLVIR